MNLFDCVGSLAWPLIIQSGITMVLYFMIAKYRFVPAARMSKSAPSRHAWVAVSVLFPACGVCGYGTTVLAGWYPVAAYSMKSGMMSIGIIACTVFLIMTRGHNLMAEPISQSAKSIIQDRTLTPTQALQQLRDTIDNDN